MLTPLGLSVGNWEALCRPLGHRQVSRFSRRRRPHLRRNKRFRARELCFPHRTQEDGYFNPSFLAASQWPSDDAELEVRTRKWAPDTAPSSEWVWAFGRHRGHKELYKFKEADAHQSFFIPICWELGRRQFRCAWGIKGPNICTPRVARRESTLSGMRMKVHSAWPGGVIGGRRMSLYHELAYGGILRECERSARETMTRRRASRPFVRRDWIRQGGGRRHDPDLITCRGAGPENLRRISVYGLTSTPHITDRTWR